ncbi:thioredoxin family protein [Chlamydiia bacterium]|nr:thioredoxin family protein [Chlamydiia bacterium]
MKYISFFLSIFTVLALTNTVYGGSCHCVDKDGLHSHSETTKKKDDIIMRDYQGLEWFTNIEDTYNSGKYSHVLVLFTGSDWCQPCKQLASEKLSSKKFHTYIKENGVGLVILDSPNSEELNSQIDAVYVMEMKKKFKIRGVPTIVTLDKDQMEMTRQEGYSHVYFDDFISKSFDK